MAAFSYQALNAQGKKVKGVLEADNARQARQLLREQKLTPLSLEAAAEKEKQRQGQSRLFQARISATELALITRQIATLVEAALPIESVLQAVAEQCEKPRLRNMMMVVRSKVVEGYSLAEGLAEFPHVFDHLFRSMVAAGERSGHLDAVLLRLADYTEQRDHMRTQLMLAMLYPLIMVIVAVGVVVTLLVAVVPKIVDQFDTLGQALPWSTRFLIDASDFLNAWGLLIALVSIAAIAVWQQALRKPTVRLSYDERLLSMPLLGRVARGLNTARFARTLSILNASAVPLLEAMRISSDVLDNVYMRQQLAEASARVREGASLKAALEQTKLFSPMMLHMIASGEKSGQLEGMLERAATSQDREFETQVQIALKVMQPAIMLAMAGVVFFIVLSILQPILAMNNLVGGVK